MTPAAERAHILHTHIDWHGQWCAGHLRTGHYEGDLVVLAQPYRQGLGTVRVLCRDCDRRRTAAPTADPWPPGRMPARTDLAAPAPAPPDP